MLVSCASPCRRAERNDGLGDLSKFDLGPTGYVSFRVVKS